MGETEPVIIGLPYYETFDEAQRLVTGAVNTLARLRTWELFARFVPPGAVVADVGGGPGVHARHLAEQGHRVTVVDPVPRHVDQASTIDGVTAVLGDALRLPLPDASCDVVLLMGPLYHLPEAADRHAALREAGRVLRPGGRLIAEVITRHAWLVEATIRGLLGDPETRHDISVNLATGFTSDTPGPEDFHAYLHRTHHLAPEVTAAGFEVDTVVAVEGFAALLGNLADLLTDPTDLLDVLREVESEPSMIGVSPHVQAIAHLPAG